MLRSCEGYLESDCLQNLILVHLMIIFCKLNLNKQISEAANKPLAARDNKPTFIVAKRV